MEINAGLTIDNKFVVYGKDDENPLFMIDLSNKELDELYLITDDDRVNIAKSALHTFVDIVKNKTSNVAIETKQTELLDQSLTEENE